MTLIWKDWLANASDADASVELLRPEHLDEVLRMIRLHDTDDHEAARAGFEYYDFDAYLEQSAHFVLIDRAEQRPVGVSGYYIEDFEARDVFWLGWTYVNPFFQGKGYGSRLVEFVLETVGRLGGRKVYLATSELTKYETAVRFYERHGFELEARLSDYYADGEDKLIFGKHLLR